MRTSNNDKDGISGEQAHPLIPFLSLLKHPSGAFLNPSRAVEKCGKNYKKSIQKSIDISEFKRYYRDSF